MGTEMMFDPEVGHVEIINDTGVSNDAVIGALQSQAPEVAALVRWTNDTKMPPSRRGGLFERDRYVTPDSPRDQMKVAYHASETDDVVSGVIESTEALAFAKMSIDTDDEDQTDVWNQIAEELDMDRRLREMWKEDFTVSQFICATWWGTRSYKVRGKTDKGVTRKKTFENMTVPIGLTMLDPLKVVPVGNLLFNKEMLAFQADSGAEHDLFQAVINGEKEDEVISQLMVGKYQPDNTERKLLGQDGIQTERLFLLNPANVWRHHDTKMQYQRYAPLRMRSVFELLDLKTQLRAMDRAHLLGGTNFIVLVKKGDKDRPAKPGEIAALQSNVRSLARVPVIVGDDRLSIEIITPKTDNTLQPERYNGLDARITARLFQMFMTGNFCLTPDHEVLTQDRGWIPVEDVKIGEMVGSWKVDPADHTKGITVWSEVADTPRFEYSGKMLDVRTGPSMCVTPNHMLRWRGNASASVWRWGRADELKDSQSVPAPCNPLPFTTSTISQDEMELYGWWISEGSGRVGLMTRFTQVKAEGRRQLFDLLDRMEIRYKAYGKEIRTDWHPEHHVGDKALVKFIPRALMQEEHVVHLLKGLMRGDGSFRREGGEYSTSSPELADDVQELGTRLGLRTRIMRRETARADSYKVSLYPRPEWSLNLRFSDKDGKTGGPANASWIDYSGMVYCLTVPETGTFLVRRNGQVHVTGNSAGAKGDDSVKLAKIVARGLESRRHMIRRSVEQHVLFPTQHANVDFTERPKLRFHPKRIALDFDPTYATFLLDVFDRGPFSMESLLEEIDYDLVVEYRRRKAEADKYEEVLQPRAAPGASNLGAGSDPKAAGRQQGGLKGGGGAAPGSGQGQPAKNPAKKADNGSSRKTK